MGISQAFSLLLHRQTAPVCNLCVFVASRSNISSHLIDDRRTASHRGYIVFHLA